MDNIGEILERIKIKNEILNQKLKLSIYNLEEKIKEEDEKINVIIKAAELLFFEKSSEISKYENFSLHCDIKGKKCLVIYHDEDFNDKFIIEIKKLIYTRDCAGLISAYKAIEIYEKLQTCIEKLLNIALINIQNEFNEMERLYKPN